MIDNLKIENFKIHKLTDLQLSNLNVLTGINSSGKSSVIQSLLLLRQSFLNFGTGLELGGDLCAIGLTEDALCQYADNDVISFSLKANNSTLKVEYDASHQPRKSYLQEKTYQHFDLEEMRSINLFSRNFQYISASRLEPQESYLLDTNGVEIKNQISLNKGKCELAVHYLHYYSKEKHYQIDEKLKYDNVNSLDLMDQVSAWESAISSNVNVITRPEGKAYVLKYSYNKVGDISTSQEFNATNVGFGLSYALPIVVALLTAQKDSLIIIENPEAHLHPSGQAEMAKLIARAAQNGVQIVVETHSDHIINGILVASKQFENTGVGIDKDKVKIYYFIKDEKYQVASHETINIIGDGKIDKQPQGFVDQVEKDLGYILGF